MTEAQFRSAWRKFDETKSFVVATAIVRTAAREAGGLAAHRADAWDLDAARGAPVAQRRAQLAARERKIVAALFIHKSEIDARRLPLATVRGDAAASSAMMRQQVRQLVAQGAVDLGVPKFTKSRIQVDKPLRGERGARRGAHPRVPPDDDNRREFVAADAAEEGAGGVLPRIIRHELRRTGGAKCAARGCGEFGEKVELHRGVIFPQARAA